MSVNYNGMHGIHIPIDDNGMNAYCPPTACPSGFPGLPASVPNASFGRGEPDPLGGHFQL